MTSFLFVLRLCGAGSKIIGHKYFNIFRSSLLDECSRR